MTKKLSLVLATTLICTFLLAACGSETSANPPTSPTDPSISNNVEASESQPITIIWGNYGNRSMPPAKADLDAIAYIEEKTGGSIIYDYVPDGVLGGESDMMQQIMDGTIQCIEASASTLNMYSQLSEAFQLPFLITDYEMEQKALSSDAAQAIYDKIGSELGLKILYFQENGMRHFANNNHPIACVEDLKGMKLRIAPSNMLTEAITNLGASPVTVAYADVYSALQNKVVDGEEINITSIYALKHYEVLKYISEIGMYPYPAFIVYNLDFWNSLTEEQRSIILEGHKLSTETLFDTYLPDYEKEAVQACKDAGVKFNTIDGAAKEAFLESAQPIWDEYRAIDPLIADFIDYVQSQN